jgi:hypothetical protein
MLMADRSSADSTANARKPSLQSLSIFVSRKGKRLVLNRNITRKVKAYLHSSNKPISLICLNSSHGQECVQYRLHISALVAVQN